MGSVLERGVVAAYSAVASATMAVPPKRTSCPQFVARVAGVRDLSPMFRRVTLDAPELETLERLGADEYVGLFMPRPGVPVQLPPAGDNPRGELTRVPEDVRPDLRWYTIRAQRGSQIDIDIVNSAHDGPGARWTRAVRPGDEVGVRVQGALYAGAPAGGHQVLLADETGLPGLLAILEAHPDRALTALVEVPTAEFVHDEVVAAGVPVVLRGDSAPGSALLAELEQAIVAPIDYAWVCAEAGTIAACRRHLVKQRGVSRRAVMASGFWRVGAPRP
ncbi:siderophore-interacting protein [Mobilicoccus massiliensis]|uniref:siderophore-interacting protein n=1 Tax=Mobilicoccus massiliensis TaxID=1522310 RepID=UPI000693FC09|nr:siderophore-interacting protein [Mobilicoccus massiliensis]